MIHKIPQRFFDVFRFAAEGLRLVPYETET